MAEIRRATLFGKLNPIAYKAIESATVFCKMRGNPYVETLHWLHQLLQLPDSDVHRIIKHFQLDPSHVAADLIASLDKLPRGATPSLTSRPTSPPSSSAAGSSARSSSANFRSAPAISSFCRGGGETHSELLALRN